MIYTIGYRKNYDAGILQYGKDFRKQGSDTPLGEEPYAGGSVWQSRKDAETFLSDNHPRLHEYGVYGVLADWESDTEQLPGEPFRRLIRTSQIVSLDET